MGIFISLNGDSAQDIISTRADATAAVRILDETMRAAAPHGRNYRTNLEYLAARAVYDNLQHAMNEVVRMWTADATAAYAYKSAQKR